MPSAPRGSNTAHLNPSTKAFYKWKANGKDYGLENLAKSFFAKEQVLRLLQDYAIFYRMDDALQKFVLRPHQMRVVEKIEERVVAAQSDDAATGTGLESHTQGSGKTLSMIVAAAKLRRRHELSNPTLFIVVDRVELETQMAQNLEAFGLDAIVAQSKHHLRTLLNHDARGVIVTTIHKFDGMPKNRTSRRNVVLLVDEAHRSQEGELGIYMRAALPNALRFGFTGTPIDRGRWAAPTKSSAARSTPKACMTSTPSTRASGTDHAAALVYAGPTNIWVTSSSWRGVSGLLEEFWETVTRKGRAARRRSAGLAARRQAMAVLKAPSASPPLQNTSPNTSRITSCRRLKGWSSRLTARRRALQAGPRPVPAAGVERRRLFGERKKTASSCRSLSGGGEEKRIRKAFRDGQGPQAAHRHPEAADRLRHAGGLCHVPGQAAQGPHAAAGHRPRQRPYPGKDSGLVVDYIGVFKDLQRASALTAAAMSAASSTWSS